MVYLSVLSQHRETAAVCGNHYAASAELPLLINHTPRWPCKQQQQQLCNAAHRKLSYECDIWKQTMLLGWLFGNCLLCCACPSNGSAGTWKTADHLLPSGSSHPRGRHKGWSQSSALFLCEGLLRSAAGEVTASTLRAGARFL